MQVRFISLFGIHFKTRYLSLSIHFFEFISMNVPNAATPMPTTAAVAIWSILLPPWLDGAGGVSAGVGRVQPAGVQQLSPPPCGEILLSKSDEVTNLSPSTRAKPLRESMRPSSLRVTDLETLRMEKCWTSLLTGSALVTLCLTSYFINSVLSTAPKTLPLASCTGN